MPGPDEHTRTPIAEAFAEAFAADDAGPLRRFASELAAVARARQADEEPTLEVALESAEADLIREAIDGEDPHNLAAQALAVQTMRTLMPLPDVAVDSLVELRTRAVVAAARGMVETVKASHLEAGHFAGVFNDLLAPLEELGDALEAMDAQR